MWNELLIGFRIDNESYNKFRFGDPPAYTYKISNEITEYLALV